MTTLISPPSPPTRPHTDTQRHPGAQVSPVADRSSPKRPAEGSDSVASCESSSSGGTTLRCATTADFLAALPELVGFTAPNSIFVVFFTGRRAAQSARLDLPPDLDPAHRDRTLDSMCELLAELGAGRGASSPAIVITTEQSFAAAGDVPWRSFARRLERRLRVGGIHLREFCCVASDAWASYLDPQVSHLGRPLTEIAESAVAVAAKLRGKGTPPPLSELGTIPPAVPARVAAVDAAFDGVQQRWHASKRHDRLPEVPGSTRSAAAATRALLGDKRLTPAQIANTAYSASQLASWIQLAIGLCTRAELPAKLGTTLGWEVFERIAAAASTSSTASETDTQPGRPTLYDLLLSLSCEASASIKTRRFRQRLIATLSEVPPDHRAGLLLLSAWAWWTAGNLSVARRHYAAAQPAEQLSQLAATLQQLFEVPFPLRAARRAARSERRARDAS